jgi:hypothetical protein
VCSGDRAKACPPETNIDFFTEAIGQDVCSLRRHTGYGCTAGCTADGKVHVFDLNENKNEPYCEQKAVRKAKLTKIAFNAKVSTPIIAVGDDHGCVTTMKPSPNLRWNAITKAEAVAALGKDSHYSITSWSQGS